VIVWGLVMIVSPMVGLLGTVGGMTGAFDRMGTSGIKDPGVLSANIGEVLVTTAAGLAIALVALPLFVTFCVLMIRENRRIEKMLASPGASAVQ
jgi:biopolymer transport protein ExbB/TolQ